MQTSYQIYIPSNANKLSNIYHQMQISYQIYTIKCKQAIKYIPSNANKLSYIYTIKCKQAIKYIPSSANKLSNIYHQMQIYVQLYYILFLYMKKERKFNSLFELIICSVLI